MGLTSVSVLSVNYHSKPPGGASAPLFVNRQKRKEDDVGKNKETKEDKQTQITQKILEELKIIVALLFPVCIIHDGGVECQKTTRTTLSE